MMRFDIRLICIAALVIAGCSCVDKAQELSTYWEGYDFRSLEAFDDLDEAEDKFDRYIDLLTQVSHEEAVESLNEFLDSAALDTVAYMVWSSWFEPFLHAKESPYRNDRLFAIWLDRVLEDKVIADGAMIERYQQIKDVIGLNIVGQPVADVLLRDYEGTDIRMADLKGQQTLLLLLDANCPSCLDYLNDNLNEYGHKNIRLIAVLVNGSPIHMDGITSRLSEEVLSGWTLTWCPGREIEKGQIYDLTMIPSRILLDRECRIKKLYY